MPALVRLLARLVAWLFVLEALAAVAYWAWDQPFMARTRAQWELSRMPPPVAVAMPVQGVAADQVADTFGAPRGRDRRHEGVDIFATRGTPPHLHYGIYGEAGAIDPLPLLRARGRRGRAAEAAAEQP